MAQLQISFAVEAQELEGVEELLQGLGAWAHTCQGEDDDILLEPGVGEHPLWGRVRISAIFDPDQDERRLRRLLEGSLGRDLADWQCEHLEDRSWEREWLEYFQPISFGQRLWVVPSGFRSEIPGDAVAVHLDPGLAFGTGTHETTALCLEWLDGEPLAGARGIDYGAGSGVLAVAAVKLGANECIAVDNDPQAVRASSDNATRNEIAHAVPCYLVGDQPEYCADFLIANILSSTLIGLADELLASVRDGGRLALSGILFAQRQRVMEAFGTQVAWDPPRRKGDWVLLSGTRSRPSTVLS